MMHGRGESDSAIVAGKPTNKAERSAAEPVEPRAEAKGNASQQKHGPGPEPGTIISLSLGWCAPCRCARSCTKQVAGNVDYREAPLLLRLRFKVCLD